MIKQILGKKRLFEIENKFLWLSVAIAFRLIICLFFVYQSNIYLKDRLNSGFVIISNDYGQLLRPVDNFFKTGVYEVREGSGLPYAGRLHLVIAFHICY